MVQEDLHSLRGIRLAPGSRFLGSATCPV